MQSFDEEFNILLNEISKHLPNDIIIPSITESIEAVVETDNVDFLAGSNIFNTLSTQKVPTSSFPSEFMLMAVFWMTYPRGIVC